MNSGSFSSSPESVWDGFWQSVSEFAGGLIEPVAALSLALVFVLLLARVLARPLRFVEEVLAIFAIQLFGWDSGDTSA